MTRDGRYAVTGTWTLILQACSYMKLSLLGGKHVSERTLE